MSSAATEDAVRQEVSRRIGRDLTDTFWREAYGRAQRKLRHIITIYGDEDGARNTVDYITQLTIEAIRSELMAQMTLAMCKDKK